MSSMSPQEHTREDLMRRAEDDAKSILGVSLDEAFCMLDRGELAATAVEAELRMARFMLDH